MPTRYKDKSFLKGVRYCLEGISYTFKNERNFRIETLLGIIAVILSFVFNMTYRNINRPKIPLVVGIMAMFINIRSALSTALPIGRFKGSLCPFGMQLNSCSALSFA